jgi:hypothetical protein
VITMLAILTAKDFIVPESDFVAGLGIVVATAPRALPTCMPCLTAYAVAVVLSLVRRWAPNAIMTRR